MLLAAVTILLLTTKIFATETGSHCIDYDNFVYSTPGQAISYDDSSRRFGAVDCLQGDIVLAGTYINLGNTAEFYTSQCLQIRACELCMMDYLYY